MWPLARQRRRQGGESAGVPARRLTGGEVEVAREHEEVKARRLVVLVRAGVFPTVRCGGGSDSSPAAVLWRWNGGVEGSGSCAMLGRC